MISDTKHKELRNRYNPDNSSLRKMQLNMLDILLYFDKFCMDNNIRYWLSSGTLLGAVRHKGFIPWDDDLDVEMLTGDYDKFVSLRDKFDNNIYILQDKKSDSEYIAPFPKIRLIGSHIKEIHNRDIGYKYDGLYIDIFIRDRSTFLCTKISHVFQYLSFLISSRNNVFIRRILKNTCYYSMHYLVFPVMKLIDILFSDKESYGYKLGTGFYDRMKDTDLFPLGQVSFENHIFPAPYNTDGYLKEMYGNYEELPDLDNLRVHTITRV